MAYIQNCEQALTYTKFRPTHPEELGNKILSFLREGVEGPLKIALDVGCGSGQGTEILAPHFEKVIGIDNSTEQIEYAEIKKQHENVFYRVGTAEQLGEEDGSVDLVTVGMAVHWFQLDEFLYEVGRVLRPKGVLAIYGYNMPQATVADFSLYDLVEDMVENVLGEYVFDKSKLAYAGYKGPQFSQVPFSSQPSLRLEFPSTKTNASVEELAGYISSTSRFQNCLRQIGKEKAYGLLSEFKCRISDRLGIQPSDSEGVILSITFPYVLLLSRKDI